MAAPTLPATAMESRRKWSRRRVDRLNVSACRVSGGASGQGLILWIRHMCLSLLRIVCRILFLLMGGGLLYYIY